MKNLEKGTWTSFKGSSIQPCTLDQSQIFGKSLKSEVSINIYYHEQFKYYPDTILCQVIFI